MRDGESAWPGLLRPVRHALDARRLRLSQFGRLNRTAIIFAGGRATRLGGVNKALLDVGGVRIIDRIRTALLPLVDEQILLVNDATFQSTAGLRVVFDSEPHAGVLPALLAGLEAASTEICLAVACDMPFISREVFEHLLRLQREASADVVIPRTGGYLEPMHAVYRTQTVRTAIQAALERGEQRMISYFRDVRVREVDESEWRSIDPIGRAFFNVNTNQDLAEARRLAEPDSQPSAQG